MLVIPTEIYSRISGYYRPVRQWNKGKQAEFNERRPVKVEDIGLQMAKRIRPENGEVHS